MLTGITSKTLSLLGYCDAAVMRRSVTVAAVVGPTLIFVNQGSSLLNGAALDGGKAALTMLVPLLVSCFSGSLARLHGAGEVASIENRLATGLDPIVDMVKQVQSNAVNVNTTAKARYEGTQALLRRAQDTVEEIRGGASLVQSTLDASSEVQTHFDLVLNAEHEVRAEIASNSASAAAVSSAVATARERFLLISNLASEIERIGHQTTILSLNAAVVAATAGVEGRPFATIAESVRELARATEVQAKTIRATAFDLEVSASAMAEESSKLNAGMDRLSTCSERASKALEDAAASLARSSASTRGSLQLLSTQSVHIRDIADGIGHVVDHAGTAIEGSARNAEIAGRIVQRLGGLSETR